MRRGGDVTADDATGVGGRAGDASAALAAMARATAAADVTGVIDPGDDTVAGVAAVDGAADAVSPPAAVPAAPTPAAVPVATVTVAVAAALPAALDDGGTCGALTGGRCLAPLAAVSWNADALKRLPNTLNGDDSTGGCGEPTLDSGGRDVATAAT